MAMTMETATLPGVKALYLRKSRDESNGTVDVLSKHRMVLTEFCQRNGWNYVVYEEIGSSDSLENRPKMMQLLEDVEEGKFDAVVVVDYDRLSRGDEFDHAFIKRIFRKAGIKVLTPHKTYDLDDESSELLMGIEALVARAEYRKIKRRLKAGKLNGAKQGKWVQGNPPFPYAYDQANKTLVVDEDKRPIYEMMKQMALDGVSPQDIAYKVNGMGVYGNRGKRWYPESVLRVLVNPVHRGHIIYQRSKTAEDGSRINLPPEEWITGEGDHEQLVTEDEYARIRHLTDVRRRIPKKSREGKTPLSGLVKCADCGRTHVSTRHSQMGYAIVTACAARSAVGEKCGNGGAKAEYVYAAITEAVAGELERLKATVEQAEVQVYDTQAGIENKRTELAVLEAKLERLVDLYMDGELTKDMYGKKKAPLEAEIVKVKSEIASLEQATSSGELTKEERMEKLTLVLGDFWTSDRWTDKERHTILTTLIDHIEMRSHLRKGKLEIKVVFR